MGILAFIIILSLLVLVHEMGHFFTARKLGIAVEEFGIGLPPRAFGKKFGDTIYSINWVPLGGFVRIKGEQGESPDDSDSFINRPIWQRAVVVSAGVIMNAVFAAFLLTIGFTIGTPQIIDELDTDGATVHQQEIRVASVLEGFPAAEAGLEIGDSILDVNGTKVSSVTGVQEIVAAEVGNEVPITYVRDGVNMSGVLTPVIYQGDTEEIERGVMGVELITTGIVSYPIHIAFYNGVVMTGTLLKEITVAFGTVIYDFITGARITVDLAGPVGIAVITQEVTELGFIYLLQFAAILSINLAIINFIPFPALDGGRFWFLMAEKIKGSPINQKTEALIHNGGFALLMVLIALVTIRDLSNLNFWEKITNFL